MELDQNVTYQVYLLRLWRERPASPGWPAVWRYSLEDTRTRQRHGFGSLEELTAFLRTRVLGGVDAEPNTQDSRALLASERP